MHDVLNELLCTDNSYYKSVEIQLVLDTIHDKMCKFVLQPDDIDEQPSQQQSPDDIPEAEEITDKLTEIKDMEELDARSFNNITGLFAALQMYHENSTKMAGHLVQLGSTLTTKHLCHEKFFMSLGTDIITTTPVQPSRLEVSKIVFNTPRNKRRNRHKPVLAQTIPPGVSPNTPPTALWQLSTQSCRDIYSTAKKVPQPSLKNSKLPPRNYMKDLQESGMILDKNSPKWKKLHEKLQRSHHQPHQPHHQPHQPNHQPLQPHLHRKNPNQLPKLTQKCHH